MSTENIKEKKTLILILVGIPLIVILLSILNVGRALEWKLMDWRFRLRGERSLSENVFLVAIEDSSVSPEGFGRWPWRRGYMAAILDTIRPYYPHSLVFDILFPEPSEDFPGDDDLLAEQSLIMGRVHYPFYCMAEEAEKSKGYSNELHPTNEKLIEKISLGKASDYENAGFIKVNKLIIQIPKFSATAKNSGYVNAPSDNDGVIRRVPLIMQYKDYLIPNICFEVALDYLGVKKDDLTIVPGKYFILNSPKKGVIKIPIDSKCRMLVNHPGDFKQEVIPMISVVGLVTSHDEILSGEKPGYDLKALKDKIMFLGLAATGAHDQRPTPFSPLFPMVGFQTIITSNIIESNFLVPVADWVNFLLMIFAGFIASFITVKFKAVFSAILNILFICIYFYISLFLFKSNYVISVFYPFLAVILSYIMITMYRFTGEEREKKIIRGTFQRYVSSQVVDVILDDPSKIKLGGERKRLTVFFSDIRGFTSMSENMQPEEVVSILNEYLTEMIDIIFKYSGTLDKFIGDAVMAVWGAPVAQENHAELAVRAAWAMSEKVTEMRERWEKEGKKQIGVGMGINTGDVVVGNMGSDQYADYTVIGDNVNLAARLEENAKGGQLIISESTYEEVKAFVEVKKLEPLKVKGKEKPLEVYEVTGIKS